MTDIQKLYRRVGELEDTITRLRKDLKYQRYNLDEDSLPRLRVYSQLISQNKAAVSEVKQEVSDTQSTVTLLSQYTNMDGVVVVESSDDKSAWDKTRVYYDSTAKVYYYHDGTQWQTTVSPVTAGLDTSIAQIQAKTAENEAEIALVSQTVTRHEKSITDLQTDTGNIDKELTEVTKNLASVTTKTDELEASAELLAQSVTELENEVTGKIEAVNESIASVSAKAAENEAEIALVAKSVTDIESDISDLESSNKALNESIAAIELKAGDNAANIALVAKNVAFNASDIADLQETTGNIDKELTTVKTNLAAVETKADDAAASAEMTAQSVDALEDEVTGQITTINQNLASVSTKADNASASVSAIVTNIGSNGSVTAASIVAKINAAGSAVQISADHISLKGKTIALTTDSINIESTYFDVTTAGAVTCSSIAVSGTSSVIDITGTSSSTGKVYARYSGNSALYSQLTPAGISVYDSYFNSILGANFLQFMEQQYSYVRNAYFRPNLMIQTNGQSYPILQVITQDPPWQEQVIVGGSLAVYGVKPRVEQTDHYGDRLMYAFETPNPLYSDFGRGTIAEDGMCYVYHDPIFYECIDTEYDYYVFIQPESSGEFAVIERTADHFIVQGTPGTSFAWMLVTAQKGYSATRTEELVIPEPEPVQTPDPENVVYDAVGDEILKEFENQLG